MTPRSRFCSAECMAARDKAVAAILRMAKRERKAAIA